MFELAVHVLYAWIGAFRSSTKTNIKTKPGMITLRVCLTFSSTFLK